MKKRTAEEMALDAKRHLTAYHAAKAKGICVNCRSVPARPGFTRCGPCAKRSAANSQRFVEQAVARGLCRRCFAQPRFTTMTICLDCADTARERYIRIREHVFEHYGKQCAQCSESRQACLSIDHINDDGALHRKDTKVGGGWRFYRWLLVNDFPAGYQTLCMNCQFIKEAERRDRLRAAGTPILRGTLGVNGPPQRRRTK